MNTKITALVFSGLLAGAMLPAVADSTAPAPTGPATPSAPAVPTNDPGLGTDDGNTLPGGTTNPGTNNGATTVSYTHLTLPTICSV